MELQSGIALGEAAQDAGSSGLVDEDPLDLPSPRDDALRLASSAPKAVAPTQMPRRPMMAAEQLHFARPIAVCGGHGGAPPGGTGLQAVAAKPMPNRGRAAAEHIGDVADRELAGDDLGEQLALDGAAGGVACGV
jgi:hypothetical protein